MTGFTLTETTKVGREDCYHYEGENGQTVVFHADPTTAWNWIILDGDREVVERVIERCCEVGFRPEAIRSFDIELPGVRPLR